MSRSGSQFSLTKRKRTFKRDEEHPNGLEDDGRGGALANFFAFRFAGECEYATEYGEELFENDSRNGETALNSVDLLLQTTRPINHFHPFAELLEEFQYAANGSITWAEIR